MSFRSSFSAQPGTTGFGGAGGLSAFGGVGAAGGFGSPNKFAKQHASSVAGGAFGGGGGAFGGGAGAFGGGAGAFGGGGGGAPSFDEEKLYYHVYKIIRAEPDADPAKIRMSLEAAFNRSLFAERDLVALAIKRAKKELEAFKAEWEYQKPNEVIFSPAKSSAAIGRAPTAIGQQALAADFKAIEDFIEQERKMSSARGFPPAAAAAAAQRQPGAGFGGAPPPKRQPGGRFGGAPLSPQAKRPRFGGAGFPPANDAARFGGAGFPPAPANDAARFGGAGSAPANDSAPPTEPRLQSFVQQNVAGWFERGFALVYDDLKLEGLTPVVQKMGVISQELTDGRLKSLLADRYGNPDVQKCMDYLHNEYKRRYGGGGGGDPRQAQQFLTGYSGGGGAFDPGAGYGGVASKFGPVGGGGAARFGGGGASPVSKFAPRGATPTKGLKPGGWQMARAPPPIASIGAQLDYYEKLVNKFDVEAVFDQIKQSKMDKVPIANKLLVYRFAAKLQAEPKSKANLKTVVADMLRRERKIFDGLRGKGGKFSAGANAADGEEGKDANPRVWNGIRALVIDLLASGKSNEEILKSVRNSGGFISLQKQEGLKKAREQKKSSFTQEHKDKVAALGADALEDAEESLKLLVEGRTFKRTTVPETLLAYKLLIKYRTDTCKGLPLREKLVGELKRKEAICAKIAAVKKLESVGREARGLVDALLTEDAVDGDAPREHTDDGDAPRERTDDDIVKAVCESGLLDKVPEPSPPQKTALMLQDVKAKLASVGDDALEDAEATLKTFLEGKDRSAPFTHERLAVYRLVIRFTTAIFKGKLLRERVLKEMAKRAAICASLVAENADAAVGAAARGLIDDLLCSDDHDKTEEEIKAAVGAAGLLEKKVKRAPAARKLTLAEAKKQREEATLAWKDWKPSTAEDIEEVDLDTDDDEGDV